MYIGLCFGNALLLFIHTPLKKKKSHIAEV